MFDVGLLLVEKWSSDLVDVVEQSLSLDRAVELWMLVFKCSPVLLSDDVAAASCEGLVNKKTSFIKASFEPTNHCLSWISHFKVDLLIDFITNVIETVFHENNLINIIKLCEEESRFVVVNRFKLLQNLDHELLVLEIGPSIVTMSMFALVVWNTEVSSKVLKETFKQEVSIDGPLDLNRKLFDQVSISITGD
tara:strand:- start:241 stop:819 length:579 start_codon:yes stop_codon:yes gene_type:complete